MVKIVNLTLRLDRVGPRAIGAESGEIAGLPSRWPVKPS